MGQRLGQHFLKNKSIIQTIVRDVEEGNVVFEIGPGRGALTKELLKKGAKVVAIEKDEALVEYLLEKFKDENIEVIQNDIRDYEIEIKEKYKVIANIPYYITGQIIKQVLTSKNKPTDIILLIQKEVAERIVSEKESLLSLSVKFFGDVKYIKTVNKRFFSPPPKVDSAVIHITNIQKQSNEKKFFEIINTAFKEKRKVVLKKFKDDKKTYNKLVKLGVDEKTRAEDISINIWRKVT